MARFSCIFLVPVIALILSIHWPTQSALAAPASTTRPSSGLFDVENDLNKPAPTPAKPEKASPVPSIPKPHKLPKPSVPPPEPESLKWGGVAITDSPPKSAITEPPAATAESIAKAEQVLREMYSEEFADTTLAGKRKLGRKLLELALATTKDPSARQAALQTARKIAVEIHDTETVQSADAALDGNSTKSVATTQPAPKAPVSDKPKRWTELRY